MSLEAHPTQESPPKVLSLQEIISVFLISLLFFYVTSASLGVWEIGESLHARIIKWMWAHETWMQVNLPLDEERVRACIELAMGWWPSMLSVHWLAPQLGIMSPELALRLPSLILASLNICVLYSLMTAWQKKRLFALLVIGFLMIMPSFNIASRHTLIAGGIGGLACSLSILCFLYQVFSRSLAIKALAIISLILSAGALGAVGLFLPLTAYFLINKQARHLWLFPTLGVIALFYWRSWVKRPEQADLWHLFFTLDPLKESYHYAEWSGFQNMLHLIGFNLFPFGALIPILALSLKDLDHGTGISKYAKQFELGQTFLWLFVTTFFSCVLLAPSGGYWGGASLLLAIPLAIASAHYFLTNDVQAKFPLLYTLTIIFLWWLIDGNLKREPGFIIAAVSDESVKGLLPDFNEWRFGRIFSLFGLLVIITTRTPLVSRAWQVIKSKLQQESTPRHHWGLSLIAVSVAFISIFPYLITVLPKWIVSSAFVNAPFWGRVPFQVKVITFAILIAFLAYHLLWLLWRSYAEKRTYHFISKLDFEWGFLLSWLIILPHYIGRLPMWRFMRPVLPYLENPTTHKPIYALTLVMHLALVIILGLIVALFRKSFNYLCKELLKDEPVSLQDVLVQKIGIWAFWQREIFVNRSLRLSLMVVIWLSASLVFSQGFYLQGLSSHFSHKDMIHGYQSLLNKSQQAQTKQAQTQQTSSSSSDPQIDPELKLYKVKDAQKSFYLSDLKDLKKTEFMSSAQDKTRQYYVINRDRLSEVNQEFRRVTDSHLPILDDRHHELLLASNQIMAGEDDYNPIKHAIVDEIPKGAVTLDEAINFEDQIELVAWRLNPAQPRAGAPLKIELFWKAKRKIRHTWKVFVHIDAPGQRIHADHDPVAGVYPTQNWQVGDIISDQHHITVKRSIKPATFTFFVGLYRGKTRMKIRNSDKKLKDHDNRAVIGKVRVR